MGIDEELSSYLNPDIARFLQNVSKAISQDPGLPRPNPTTSSWQVPEHPFGSIQSPTLPKQTDFVVIGSGITGCSVTKTLLEHGASRNSHVTILEARTLVSGATGRNGGHLVTASGHTYGPLAAQHGDEAAKQITRFSILNVDRIMEMVMAMDAEAQERCQIRDVLKVMAVGDEETWTAAKRSVLEFQRAVPEHSEYHRIIESDDVPERWNIKGAYGAVEHDAGAVWPYRLIMGIYEALLKQDRTRLAIEANTPVLQVQFLPSRNPGHPYLITTPRGTIRARKVIHCTNGHASHLLPQLAGRIYPFRGTMSVQKPGPNLKNLGASRSWSLSHKPTLDARSGLYVTGLYYLQQNPLTGRIWIGNETANMKDILTSDDTYVPKEARDALSTVLPKLFLDGWAPEVKTSEVEAIWSGIQGHTADGLPIVGRIPDSITGDAGGGQWIAAGFNGYGMDKCWLTGEALVRMMFREDVSDWFPRAYVVTEKRLREKLTADETLLKFAKLANPQGVKLSKL
ncbi:FAD dependent oxidoreductase-domain-containing protein [Colletotrichum godetiae]|uniref:FAD dependent oxidoreductase-domain-containing protein n=1 Tax=Colletotrichum godetiae TaxID=1209918 RepID=A0AAJ0F321_9PEZI|nr:FAD dependent oxidoreductase-domain-containing protein [Colletotrichum godetiae]KAK1691108.1 FAD dependent oxidoreductase-domain-containing protein [Colletotrichum godetiae]